jgi:hypothetical protein
MTRAPLPLAEPPHDTVRPPSPRRNEDHRTHLSGGARYASAKQTQRARLRSGRWRGTFGRVVRPGDGVVTAGVTG